MNIHILNMRVFYFIFMAGLLISLPVSAQDRQLMEISSEKLYDGSIKVLFILTEVHNPKMFYYKTPSAPKVVCDFFNVKIKPGLRQEIRVDKRFIRSVRMGEHHEPKEKVRVVLDLIPGNSYTVKEIPPEPNIFSVIIRSDDIKMEQSESVAEPDKSDIDVSSSDEKHQESFSTEVETTTQVTTTQPIEMETVPDPQEDDEEISDQNLEAEKNIEAEMDQADNKDDDFFSEENEWIEKILDANEDLQAPNKWPVQKTFGTIKLIVHLDTDPNGFIALKGYAINMSDEFLYRIQLDFDVFNDNADVIEQVYADFFNVEPGERRKLNVHVGVKTASNFRLMRQLFW
jgi:hypothetical protein